VTGSVPPFELQPTLTGALLELRPLREDDFPALFAVASDPLIWEQHPEHDRWTEPVFRRYFEGAMRSGGAFLIVDRRDGRVIGSSRYHGWDPVRREVEVGWTFLARVYWGGRWNGELKRLMLAHAFRFADRVLFHIGPENHRSQRAVEKIGAVRVGVRPGEHSTHSLVYAITPEAFGRWQASLEKASHGHAG